MFKKSQRFSFRKGAPKAKIIVPLFLVRFEKTDTPTYGVVVSKQVSKKAVHRNRVKRIFISTLQEAIKDKAQTHTLVFFLRRPYTEYSKSVIIDELQSVLAKL